MNTFSFLTMDTGAAERFQVLWLPFQFLKFRNFEFSSKTWLRSKVTRVNGNCC